jgi:UDP-N-acetylglucosamine acyltransferase
MEKKLGIHSTAIIEEGAEIASDVVIGPYSVIGAKVKLGSGTKIGPHVVIQGDTTIGKNNIVHAFCSIGSEPQDLSYKGEATKVLIGDNNEFREYISINRGTLKQQGITSIGSFGYYMMYCHVGHDVTIGDHVRLVNSCNIAGHVQIGDRAILSGGTNVSQFVSIGKAAFIGGGSAIDKDIPCYTTAVGNRVLLRGINIVGLKRLGFDKNLISETVEFYRLMEISPTSAKSFCQNTEAVREYSKNPIIQDIIKFIVECKIGIPSFTA